MKGFKIVFGLCLLFLLGAAIYFLITGGYTEANMSTARGMKKGQRLNGFSILCLFIVLSGVYVFAIVADKREHRKKK